MDRRWRVDDVLSGCERGQVQLVQRIGYNKAVLAVANEMAWATWAGAAEQNSVRTETA